MLSGQDEFAVACSDGRLEPQRYGSLVGAESYVAYLYAVKEEHRQEAAAWEREHAQTGGLPGGTNEPIFRWKEWRDREWHVVVREVTPWRRA